MDLTTKRKSFLRINFKIWHEEFASFANSLSSFFILDFFPIWIGKWDEFDLFIFSKTIFFLFSFAVIFQLVTLPVEFNASKRALVLLEDQGILSEQELPYTRKVLGAAALTYVASAASAILQLLRIIMLFGGRRRDD